MHRRGYERRQGLAGMVDVALGAGCGSERLPGRWECEGHAILDLQCSLAAPVQGNVIYGLAGSCNLIIMKDADSVGVWHSMR